MTLKRALEKSSDPRPVPSWRLCALVIAGAVLLAWSVSLSAPFALDDHNSILDNPTLRHAGQWLTPPSSVGQTVGGRPVLNLSFGLNHAVGGLDVRGYRLINIAIHVCSALVLFGLTRRLVGRPGVDPRLRSSATGIALAGALLWAVHPLQTQAVTYIVQRAESLMGLFYLLTLYGFVRSLDSTRSRVWQVLAVVACALGMATKENMVSAPLAVLLADRAFVAGSFAAAWRARRSFYGWLASSWLLLAALVLGTGLNRGGSVGVGVDVGWWEYWLTQFPAITRYISLVAWPAPLVFDRGALFVSSLREIAVPALIVTAIVGVTVVALRRWPRVGFVAAVALAVLAPTSIMPGTLQMIVEHRMYLPSAGVLVLACVGAGFLWGQFHRRAVVGAVAMLALALVVQTLARNWTYQSELRLWADTVAKAPENPRAHNNLGLALRSAGHPDEAMREFQRAIELQPNHAFAHSNLGVSYVAQRRWDDAEREFRAALQADPHDQNARSNRGYVLAQLGRRQEAIAEYEAVLHRDPQAVDVATNLAALFVDAGREAEAEVLLRRALVVSPGLAEARYFLGRVLEKADAAEAAIAEYRSAVELKPGFAEAHLALGNVLAGLGRITEAEGEYRRVLALDPSSGEGEFALGNVLASREDFPGAMAAFGRALERDPQHAQARNNLANCQLVTGRFAEAISNYEQVLRVRPQDDAVRRNLEVARQQAGRGGSGR